VHYLVVRAAVADLSGRVVRASSLVENWNLLSALLPCILFDFLSSCSALSI
jgi:hypothetical protein